MKSLKQGLLTPLCREDCIPTQGCAHHNTPLLLKGRTSCNEEADIPIGFALLEEGLILAVGEVEGDSACPAVAKAVGFGGHELLVGLQLGAQRYLTHPSCALLPSRNVLTREHLQCTQVLGLFFFSTQGLLCGHTSQGI